MGQELNLSGVPVGYLDMAEVLSLYERMGFNEIQPNETLTFWLRSHQRLATRAEGVMRQDHVLLSVVVPDLWRQVASGVLPIQLGVDGEGWYPIREVLLPEGAGVGVPSWILLKVGPLVALPPYVRLSEYDIGHDVVVMAGEAMGIRGPVRDMRMNPKQGLAYQLKDVASHRGEFLGAVVTGDLEKDLELAPLRTRLPEGSKVWVLYTTSWEEGIISDYTGVRVHVWLTQQKCVWGVARNRNLLKPYTPQSPPTKLAETPRNRQVPRSNRPTTLLNRLTSPKDGTLFITNPSD